MTEDSYKIIISISHHYITFEYWQRDGENKLVPMPNGNWPAPLAFYCSETGLIIGEDAQRAVANGTTNAFDNYFEKSAGELTYTIGGQTRPVRNLLLDASESIFRDFFQKILFNREGSLSDNRAKMPLTLVCETDIKPNERVLLQGLFRDSGYNRVRVINYDTYINRYINESLSKEYVCDNVVVAWAEGNDLTFSLFAVDNDSKPVVKTYENLGIDPRHKYVQNLIWERVVGQNPWLQKSTEEDVISKAASDFIRSTLPLVNESIVLSDGQAYSYSLNRNAIDYIQNSDGISVKEVLERFLQENGIGNRSRTLLLLRGKIAGNTYFEQNLSSGFGKIIKTDKKLRDNTMQLIISEDNPCSDPKPAPYRPSPNNHVDSEYQKPDYQKGVKELNRKWRGIKAEVRGKQRCGQSEAARQMLKDFLTECQSVSGMDNIIAEINSDLARYNGHYSDPIDTDLIKSHEREWREVKAIAKSNVRSGNTSKARQILETFLESIKKVNGIENLVKVVECEISQLPGPRATPSTIEDRKEKTSCKGRKEDEKNNFQTKEANERSTHEIEVKTLISQCRLKEARDWYRSRNNNTMASLLTDIIRSKKGIDHRKSMIEEYQKSRNKEQINRIIQEIKEFIGICEKVGLNTSEYKELLSAYRKI